MKLKKVQIKDFQSIRDSNEFELGDITCLVGKNEAGKTALLQALYRLNPIEENKNEFSITDDYPRWDVEDYRQNVESDRQEHAIVVKVTYELEEKDTNKVSEIFGKKALKKKELVLTRGYENKTHYQIQVDESSALKHVLKSYDVTKEVSDAFKKVNTIDDALEVIEKQEKTDSINQLSAFLNKLSENGISHYIYNSILDSHIPKFLYFDQYYQMEGCANIQRLIERKKQRTLKESDYPLLGLISLARLNLTELLNPGRTQELKNRLEGASNHLTKQIIKYWSQNKHLQMKFDVRPGQPNDPEGMQDGINVWADVYDTKHWVSTNIGTRSRGFVWFFSFLAWYSDIKKQNQSLILLLDEPGLFLHAKAQEDLLKYFDQELLGEHQLIYTTHSPFMIDPTHFERVRIVEDKGIDSDDPLPPEEEGTKVLTEVLDASGDSLFPLQGALGYEIHQTLFIGPNSLVVEGPSDLLYLQIMSSILERSGKKGLSPEWTITPVGGSDKVPTFVALIGAQKNLNVATLIDFQKKDRQVIENLYKRKLLKKKNTLTFADFVKSDEADIEDMFEIDFYLKLVNAEYKNSLTQQIKVSDLKSNLPRITQMFEEYFEKNSMKDSTSFNHYRPARYFSENIDKLEKEISDETLNRFEKAFVTLNKLI